MALELNNLPPRLAARLREFHRRRRLCELGRLGLAVVGVYLLLALLAMHIDRFLFLSPAWRVFLTVAVQSVGLLQGLFLLLRFWRRRTSPARLAYAVERQLPGSVAERLVTLAELRAGGGEDNPSAVHRRLLAQLEAEALACCESFAGAALVHDRRLRQLGLAVLAVLAVYGALLLPAAYQFPLMLRRFAQPRANLPKPSFVHLSITPEGAVLGQGGELVIQARSEGRIPAFLQPLFNRLNATSSHCRLMLYADRPDNGQRLGQPTEVVDMSRVQRTLFLFSRTDLQAGFRFKVRYADAETELFLAEVVAQPRIVDIQVRVEPPAYARLPVAELANPEGPLALLPDSSLEVTFQVDQPVANWRLRAGDERQLEAEWNEPTQTLRAAFVFAETMEIDLEVVNQRGFANLVPARLILRRREDRKPVVSLDYPGPEIDCFPGELVPLRFRAEDDLGLAALFVDYLLNPDVGDAAVETMPLELPDDPELEVAMATGLDLQRTGAMPGDTLLLTVRARDGAGNDGESRPVVVRIRPFARGDNERLRLRALRWLSDCLEEVARGSGEPTAPFAGEQAERLAERAAKLGVEGDLPDSPASLGPWLERERHFTDLPRHRDDLRQLAAVISLAAGQLPAPAAQAELLELGRQRLHRLTALRRLKNLAWQLFGVGYELAAIRDARQAGDERWQAGRRQRARQVGDFLTALVAALRADDELLAQRRRSEELEALLRQKRAAIEAKRYDAPGGLLPGFGMGEGAPAAADTPEVRTLRTELEALRAEATEVSRLQAATIEQAAARLLAPPSTHAKLRQTLEQPLLARLAQEAGRLAVAGEAPTAQSFERLVEAAIPSVPTAPIPESEALDRRAALLLATLENLGPEVLDLAAFEAGLPIDEARRLQEALISSAYQFARREPSAARQLAAYQPVRQALDELLVAVAAAMPAAAAQEQIARRRLATQADSGLGQAQLAAPGQPPPAWRANLRMHALEPFLPLWPALVEMERLLGARGQGPSGAAVAAPPPAAGALERRAQALGWRWELAEIDAAKTIGELERRLAWRILAQEVALATDATGDQPEWPSLTEMANLPPPAVDEWLAAVAPATAGQIVEWEEELAGLAGDRLPAGAGLDNLAAVADRLRQDEPLFFGVGQEVTAEAEQAVASVAALLDRHRQAIGGLEEALTGLQLRLVLFPPAPVGDQDLLFLRWREALGRFRSRSGPAVAKLDEWRRQAGGGDAKLAAAALADLERQAIALRQNLEQLLAEARNGELATAASWQKYPLLTIFEHTTLLVELATELAANRQPEAVAQRFLAAFPEAGDALLVDRLPLVDRLADSLKAAEARLTTATVDVASFHLALAQGQKSLDEFNAALTVAGEGPLAGQARRLAAELAARWRTLPLGAEAPTEAAIRQRQFVLAEINETVARLRRTLATATLQARPASLAFAGGPDDIWRPANRRHAEYARRQLEGLFEFAWGQVAKAMFVALQPDSLTAADRQAALEWSLLLHRLVRSPLTGPVVTRLPVESTAASGSPLVQWLLEQLDQGRRDAAREGAVDHYRDSTLEWLDSLRDLLRYL